MLDPENKTPNDKEKMQESERVQRQKPDAHNGLHDAETDVEEEVFGDEGEIPLRVKKKASSKGKSPSAKKKPASKAAKAKNKIRDTVEPLFSDKKFRRKKSIFDIINSTGESGRVKPIRIFGKEIRFWPLFLIIFVLILVSVVFMSNNNIQTAIQQVSVVGLPESLENYRIVVVSDLNAKRFGDEQSSLVRTVEGMGYDMVLCVGDMVGKGGDADPFLEFLDGLSKPNRVYFVAGDADPGPYRVEPRATEGTLEEIVLEDWVLEAVSKGANYVDSPIKVGIKDSYLWLTPASLLNLDASVNRANWKEQMETEQDGYLAGVAADYNSLPFTSYRYKLAQKFYEAQSEIKTTDFIIALSHQVPSDDFIKSAATHDNDDGRFIYEPELIVSGHYCGGVWKVPFAGAFYIPNNLLPRYGWFPEKEDVEGLSQISESQVYITPGLSTTSAVPALPFRLNNEPTVSQLVLTAKLPDNMLDSLN